MAQSEKSHGGSASSSEYCAERTSTPQQTNGIVPSATPIRRRGKCMSRRIGQNGNVFVKSKCKLRRCDHQKGLCPKYGRLLERPARPAGTLACCSLARERYADGCGTKPSRPHTQDAS